MIEGILSFLAMIGRLIFGHAPDPVKEAEETGERVGAEDTASTVNAASAKTEASIAKATVDAPSSKGAVVDELRKGEF